MLKAVPLGKVTVTTAGTPTPITAALITAAGNGLPPQGSVARIEFHADPAMVGTTVYVKNAAGTVIAPLLKPANGVVGMYGVGCMSFGNAVNPLDFSVDVQTNGDGVYVTVWVG